MKEKIAKNITSSIIEKMIIVVSHFIASVLLIRNLKTSDFGVIGVVVGVYAFLHVLNMSLESIILRDHESYRDNLNKYFSSFLLFSIVKSIAFLILAVVLSFIYSKIYSDTIFFYAFLSFALIISMDSITAPFILYAGTQFKQSIVAKMTFVRHALNLLLLGGIIVYPTLKYVFIKDCVLFIIMTFGWFIVGHYALNIKIKLIEMIKLFDFSFVKESILKFSLWSHLIGVVTNFIYKSDTLFLSFFAPLSAVGRYNIALNGANVANIIPAIFSYQNSIAISNSKRREEVDRITRFFVRVSVYISIFTILGFIMLGKLYLSFLTGQSTNEEIYIYMLCIVTGVTIIKSVASPVVSYINMKGSIKSLFFRVNLPMLLISSLTYSISAYYWKGIGLAMANVVNSILWLLLLIIEVKKYNLKMFVFREFLEDYTILIRFIKKKRNEKL